VAIYEYRCGNCGAEVETLTSKPQDAIPCPYCEADCPRVPSVPARVASLQAHPESRDAFAAKCVAHGATEQWAKHKSRGVHDRWRDRQVGNEYHS